MILLIDNYDSFSYNLVQLVGTIAPDIRVIRNDEMTVEQIEQLAPTHIIVSPGPGRPFRQVSVKRLSNILTAKYRSLAYVWDIRQSVRCTERP
jgi:anthranilate/para-aminobenzoate synthase component II